MFDVKDIRNELKEIRIEAGYSQRELADLIDVSYTTIQDIENGKREIWLADLDRWLAACNISTAAWLIDQLDESERAVVNRDGELLKWLRRGLRNPSQRKILEALCDQWAEYHGALAKKLKRRRDVKERPA